MNLLTILLGGKRKAARYFVKHFRDEIGIELYRAEISDWKGKADLVFHITGTAYYRFSRLENLPFCRFEKVQELLIAMDNKLTQRELGNLTRAAIGKVREGSKTALSEAEFILNEILHRRDVLHVNADLLLELMAVTIIRGDEKPEAIDAKIHEEKMVVFKDNLTKLDFFLQAGIGSFLPNLSDYTPQMVVEIIKANMAEQIKRNAITEQFLNSVGGSKSNGTTSG